jgi:4-amino-4-deoxy-L-arabinose transferase-like glycosyltransferase
VSAVHETPTSGRARVTSALRSPGSTAGAVPGWAWLVLAGITVVGFALRVAGIGESLYGDERYTHAIVTGNGPRGIWHEVYATSITPPLHYYLAWIATQLPGEDTVLLRLPSLILGTAAIPLVFLFGRRAGGVVVGLVAAALLALDPFAIFFSTEARAYETQVFLILVATLSLLRATDGGRRLWWAVWAVASAAAMWTHYTSVFVLLALPAWALWARPEHRRSVVLWGLAAIVLWLPWVPGYLHQRDNPGVDLFDVFAAHSLRTGLGYPVRVLLGHPFVALRDVPGWPILLIAAGVAALGLASLVARRPPRRGGAPGRSTLVLVVALAVITPLGTLLYGLAGPSLYLARNLSASQPAMVVLVALVACAFARRVPGRAAVPLAAVAFAGLALVAGRSLDPVNDRPPYTKAASHLEAIAGADPVIEEPGFLDSNQRLRQTPLQLYLRGPHPLYRNAGAPPAAWQQARDGGSVYFVAPVEEALLPLLGLDRVPADAQARRNQVGGPNNLLRVRSMRIFPGFDPVVVQRLSGEIQGKISGDTLDWTFGSGLPIEPGSVDGTAGVAPAPGGADIAGWAVDSRTGRPADWILVFSGDRLVAVTGLGAVSPAARDERGAPAELSGFAMRMTGEGLDPDALRVVAVAGKRAGDQPVGQR